MWKTRSPPKCSRRGRAELAPRTPRLRMVWRTKRRSASRQQPSPLAHPMRPSPQTRRDSFPCAHSFSPNPYFIQDQASKSSFEGASLGSDKNDCKTESKNESKMDRKKYSSSSQYKANMHFHKLFLDVPTEEPLRQSFTCALQKEILYQGKLFVSENWICFHSKVFGKDTKISIPVFSVTLIKKTKTALLVPNALIIATVTDRYIFVSLLSRDSTYKLLKSVCGHLENMSVGNSPNPSSLENSFRADRPSSLPLDFNDEFSDLDGVVRQRRQEMEGYSSSGSQTPESENSRDFHVTESQTVLNVSKGETKPARADAHVNRVPEGKAKSLPVHGQSETIGVLHKVKSQTRTTLHHILIFYAIVVCALIISTFYMRYRINTLEERLGSLTSIVDTHHEYKTTYRSCLRMVTDRLDGSDQHDTSCFPLKRRCSPGHCCGALPAGQRSNGHPQPRLHLEVSSSGKGGRGRNSGSCAINIDPDSEEVFSAAA
ncbi:GRAM domain-containing protein 2B isoform X2 [Canis aureus]